MAHNIWYMTYGSSTSFSYNLIYFQNHSHLLRICTKKETRKESLFPEYTMTRSQSLAVEAFFHQTM
mgnify:CR=1 FL=1